MQKEGWEEWKEEALAKGASAVHAFPVPPKVWAPEIVVTDDGPTTLKTAVLKQHQDEWSGIWQGKAYSEDGWGDLGRGVARPRSHPGPDGGKAA